MQLSSRIILHKNVSTAALSSQVGTIQTFGAPLFSISDRHLTKTASRTLLQKQGSSACKSCRGHFLKLGSMGPTASPVRQLCFTCEQPCHLVNALRVQPLLAARRQQFCYSIRAIKSLYCKQQGWQRSRAQASPEQTDSPTSASGRHCLACGQELELLSIRAKDGCSDRPPLLFLHGALHGAWCYAEHFLPYFASKGYDAHAMSFRGHGESDYVSGETGTFADHIDDIASVINSLPRPPVLIAHSLGGIVAQRYLIELAQGEENRPAVAGIGFTATPAVPAALGPSLDWFKQVKGIMHGLKIVWWMTAMPKAREELVRELFFSPDLPEELFKEYQTRMAKARTILPVNGQELMEFKSVMEAVVATAAEAPVPVFVMQAGSDSMIMPCQVCALGDMLGVQTITAPQVAHDLMLDTRWQVAAETLESWITSLVPPRSNCVPASA